MNLDKFILDRVFHKILTKDGDIVYWRSCILEKNMPHGTQGYIVVFSDGNFHHTYRYPPDWIDSE